MVPQNCMLENIQIGHGWHGGEEVPMYQMTKNLHVSLTERFATIEGQQIGKLPSIPEETGLVLMTTSRGMYQRIRLRELVSNIVNSGAINEI